MADGEQMRRRFLGSFQHLSWRLTLSYTLITVVVLLVVEAILVAIVLLFAIRSDFFPRVIIQIASTEYAPSIRRYLESTPPDSEHLQAWLETVGRQGIGTAPGQNPEIRLTGLDKGGMAIIVDRDRRVQAVLPRDSIPLGQPLDLSIIPGLETLLPAALEDSSDSYRLFIRRPDGRTVMAIPVPPEKGPVPGVIVIETELPDTRGWGEVFAAGLQLLALSSLAFVLMAGIVGMVFGLLTARGLTRRLRRLSGAAEAWSLGDFSVAANDRSGDELGQLARSLNRMAEQLQNLLATRQELAAMEERNRLARELHDSVKQQVFAATMQLGAARALLGQNTSAADQHLAEAERLAQQAQQELAVLIRELRPAALAGKPLSAALRDYLAGWSRQTGIAADVQAQGERALPLDVEQALFRITQEALANVARHSQATLVEIRLQWETETFALSIGDNGQGFDVAEAEGQGVGLTSMRERVQSVGGQMEVASAPGKGAVLYFRFDRSALGGVEEGKT